VDEINELKRSGMSIQAISELTGYDRKTIRKYLLKPAVPAYRGRPAPAGIPLGNRTAGKTLVHIQQGAPVVERRPLAAYESLVGGAR
jgi:hypothetical protein